MSPTARSLRRLRELGYLAQVVERWNPGARVRQDLYGFGDILAVHHSGAIVLVQACVAGDISKRVAKITTDPVAAKAAVWMQAGGAIWVQGWSKRGARGKRKTWALTERVVALGDLYAPLAELTPAHAGHNSSATETS